MESVQIFLLLSASVSSLFIIHFILKFLSSGCRKLPLPPGTMGWPYIGETFQLYSQNPNVFFASKVKKYGSIFKTHVLGCPCVMTSSPEAAKLVLVTKAHLFKPTFPASKERMLGKQAIFFHQGEYHAKLRKLVLRAFMPESIRTIVPDIESIAVDTLRSLEGRLITTFQEMKTYTFNVALLSIFGKDEVLYREDLKRCYYVLEKGYNSMPINLPGTLFNKSVKARRELAQILAKILSIRRESKGDHSDLLGSFMGDKEGLTDEQIADNVIGVIFAARVQTIRMVHSHIEKFGFYTDIYVPNSLIDAYSKCGSVGISESKKLFGVMVERDTVSWNSMMGGLVKAGELGVARELFDEMPERNTVSWNTMLDGHAKAGEMNKAFSLFEKMPIRNVVSWSTMVAGYSKVGDMWMARMLFDKMPVKNLVSWTIIISGYAKKGLAEEAIKLYNQMEVIGLKLDDATILSILAACAESGLLGLGEMVHNSIKSKAYKCNLHVCNALIHMYAKCGRLSMALNVFNSMKKRDLVSWNAVIHGLAMNGYGGKALKFFSRMKQEGFTPDKVTFIGVLCACSHAKLVNEGIHYFLTMESDFGVVPEIEHYGCMIDLLGRGGRLKEAYKLVHSMPFEPNVIIWGALLGACRMHNAVELAEEVLSNLIKLEPIGAENIDMLSCIHSADGNWGNVENVRLRERIHNLKALDQTPQV